MPPKSIPKGAIRRPVPGTIAKKATKVRKDSFREN